MQLTRGDDGAGGQGGRSDEEEAHLCGQGGQSRAKEYECESGVPKLLKTRIYTLCNVYLQVHFRLLEFCAYCHCIYLSFACQRPRSLARPSLHDSPFNFLGT